MSHSIVFGKTFMQIILFPQFPEEQKFSSISHISDSPKFPTFNLLLFVLSPPPANLSKDGIKVSLL